MATVAVFVALGGVSYAAMTLPKNSVGAKQIAKNAVRSAKVKDGSLLAKDFKSGQLPAGENGKAGSPGATGPVGPQGPGAISIGGQVDSGLGEHVVATINDMEVAVSCIEGGSGGVTLVVRRASPTYGFHGWGTRWTGGTVEWALDTEAPGLI